MALKFYRPLSNKIKVLSFDLDDTLYQNGEVIKNAERAQFNAICEFVPEAKALGMDFWMQLKWRVAKQKPEVMHDVSLWRYEVLKQGLSEFSVNDEAIISQVYERFYQARSDFTVPQQTFDVLAKLRQKYRLIAVTNGNADINKIGLADYFEAYYRAGEHQCRMKPHSDMLDKAAKDLGLSSPEEILHIGDNVGSDIQAAHNAKVASLWFNPEKKAFPSGHCLPNAEYSDLADLELLLA